MPEMMKAPHSKGADCTMCGGGKCKTAEGGAVGMGPYNTDSEKAERGVHHTHTRFDKLDKGQSRAGSLNQHGLEKDAKAMHHSKLSELKAMKGSDRTNLAEGGAIGEPDAKDEDGDMELSHGLGKELIGAFESKDHKKVMSALEAAVLHCMNKEDPEDV